MKKIISAFLCACLLLSLSFTAFAEGLEISVNVRVEGYDKCLYHKEVSVPFTEDMTVQDVLVYLNENDSDLNIVGADTGYITEINGEKATDKGGEFGWDGWYFALNDSVPNSGISSIAVSEKDSIVLYYGDYPCQYTQVDYSNLDKTGAIYFYSVETQYDENWNPVGTYNAPITEAKVVIGDDIYTTDENGYIFTDYESGTYSLQIEKYSSIEAPLLCRLENGYTFTSNNLLQNDSNG
ncbi:MAG: DUF4430 domain-containing protein, partial [Acutalibacteraceae bacterium]